MTNLQKNIIGWIQLIFSICLLIIIISEIVGINIYASTLISSLKLALSQNYNTYNNPQLDQTISSIWSVVHWITFTLITFAVTVLLILIQGILNISRHKDEK